MTDHKFREALHIAMQGVGMETARPHDLKHGILGDI